MPPTVRIDTPIPVFRGLPAKYTATANDPDNDGEPLTLMWTLLPDVCPNGFKTAKKWPASWSTQRDLFQFPTDGIGTSCVWVKATDKYGAVDVDAQTFVPENHPPEAVLEQLEPAPSESFPPHTMFKFSAMKSSDLDPGDTERLKAHPIWTLKPASADALGPCPEQPSLLVKCLTLSSVGDFTVEVSVSDSDTPDAVSASPASMAAIPIHIRPSPPPIAKIDLLSPSGTGPYGPLAVNGGPFPLGTLFRVSSAGSTGQGTGPVKPTWRAFQPPASAGAADSTAPSGSKAALGVCDASRPDTVRCFTADVPGRYVVALTVNDGANDSVAATATYDVLPDQPACIDATSPAFDVPTSMTEFTVVSVDDDLDPSPPNAFMQWSVSENGVDYTNKGSFPIFPLTDSFAFGETVKVRVEIHDRDTDRSSKGFLACNTDTCTLPNAFRSPCFQRVTWSVRILSR